MTDTGPFQVKNIINGLTPVLQEIITRLYEYSETGFKEYRSSRLLTRILENRGFLVERGTAQLPTAFRAVLDNNRAKDGNPVHIGLIAEYDALPGIGHGCGHNIISAVSLGTAMTLAKCLHLWNGTLTVFGTPAEEGVVDGAGGKIYMLERGAFLGVNLVLMLHPACENVVECTAIHRAAVEINFRGQPGHRAFTDTHSPVDAIAELFVKAKKYQLRESQKKNRHISIQGIINKGGELPNVSPAEAAGRFYIRSQSEATLEQCMAALSKYARNIAKKMELDTGLNEYIRRYKSFRPVAALNEAFRTILESVVPHVTTWDPRGFGSTDMGNVSQVIPSLHGYISISHRQIHAHTGEFAKQTLTAEALTGTQNGILALTRACLNFFKTKKNVDFFFQNLYNKSEIENDNP